VIYNLGYKFANSDEYVYVILTENSLGYAEPFQISHLQNKKYLIGELEIEDSDVPKPSCEILKIPQSLFIPWCNLIWQDKHADLKNNFENYILNNQAQICYSFHVHLNKSNLDANVEKILILPDQYALVVDNNGVVLHKKSLYEAALGRLMYGSFPSSNEKWCTPHVLNNQRPTKTVKKKAHKSYENQDEKKEIEVTDKKELLPFNDTNSFQTSLSSNIMDRVFKCRCHVIDEFNKHIAR